jgi:hypothetical protein
MTVLPHLSVRETVTRFRTLLPLSVLIALLLMAAIVEWAKPQRRAQMNRAAIAWIGPGAVVCLVLVCARELWQLAVVPERALLIQAAQELVRADSSRSFMPAARAQAQPSTYFEELVLEVVRAGPNDSACAPRLSDDEFTAPSSQHEFAVRGILRLARELTRRPGPASLENLAVRDLLQPSAAAGVAAPRVDLRRIGATACARANVVTPVWGAMPARTTARVE